MSKTLHVYYAKLPNMGDELNKLLIKELFGCNVVRHTYLTGRISGIGSGLGQFTLHGGPMMELAERISGFFFPNVTIWGSGFHFYLDQDKPFYRKGIRFAAVRGELSRQRVCKILGREMDIPTGDAGLLAPRLIHEKLEKKYDVGIIPHMSELRDYPEFFDQLTAHYPNSKLIRVTDDPVEVVRQIGQCRTVISSSLHGLIVADGFHIPNCHVVKKKKLGHGDGFKFDDYYSAYGIPHEFIDLNTEEPPTLEEVVARYKVPAELVEEKKQMLIDRFPG